MRNKIMITLCLIGVVPLFAAAPASKPEVAQVEEKEQETCAICLDQLHMEGKPTKILHCESRNPQARHHAFHTACIDPWLAENPRCPECRTIFSQLTDDQFILANQADAPIEERRMAQLSLGDMYLTGLGDESGVIGNYGMVPDFARARMFYNLANQADASIGTQRYAQWRLEQIRRRDKCRCMIQ